MTELSPIGLAALVAGVIMPLAICFHLIRMYREKSSEGQSVWAPATMTGGSIIWFMYGLEIGDPIVQITNTIWTVLQLTYIAFITYYRIKVNME